MSALSCIETTPTPTNAKDTNAMTTNAMTTTLTRPTSASRHEAAAPDHVPSSHVPSIHVPSIQAPSTTDTSVTLPRVARSEWMKFRTVRSNTIALGSAAAAAVGFGALFASLAGSDDGPGRLAENGLSLSLGGFQLSQIIIAILGVSLVAGEYQTGLIRTWFGAAPDRMRVLIAKVGVFGSLVFGTSLIAAVVAFLSGQALLPGGFTALTLSSDGVIQALAGQAFYMACIGIIGVGLGFLLRSTAVGAGAVVATLMIAPLMVSLLPSSIGDTLGKLLPSNAGNAVQGVETTNELLSAGWGVAVLLVWVVGIVGAAAVSLHRRDA